MSYLVPVRGSQAIQGCVERRGQPEQKLAQMLEAQAAGQEILALVGNGEADESIGDRVRAKFRAFAHDRTCSNARKVTEGKKSPSVKSSSEDRPRPG